MRKLEIENEVMQFQTIILMLMKIERVNVEMILEWLERYANIFKEPITRCVNNYESGAWEALEELKNEITFEQMIRIVEGLQSAVEKIPIHDAFDELDNEREYDLGNRVIEMSNGRGNGTIDELLNERSLDQDEYNTLQNAYQNLVAYRSILNGLDERESGKVR